WRPGSSSWIEPTAHALLALKRASRAWPGPALRDRIGMGEKMILERRCSDGGWNYGNRKVLGTELPSYPETTALALLGLSGNRSLNLAPALALAQRQFHQTRSRLARAWLSVSLRNYGIALQPPSGLADSNDVMINALETIAENGALA